MTHPHLPMPGARGRLLTQDSLGPDYTCRWCGNLLALVGPRSRVLVCLHCDTELGNRLAGDAP